MASMAKIQIIGNVGRDPEMKMTPTGKAVCEFSVAVNRVSNAGGARSEVDVAVGRQYAMAVRSTRPF